MARSSPGHPARCRTPPGASSPGVNGRPGLGPVAGRRTPGSRGRRCCPSGSAWTPSTEELLEAAASLLDPDERQVEVGDGVADEVPRPLVVERQEDEPAVNGGREPLGGERGGEAGRALV